ncbi:MAG: DUF4136 domain-containing protein [Gemmatimonadetes bacterium]|nr:DUF4136 domain-containing protein [Gemmatimonadota bacterium]
MRLKSLSLIIAASLGFGCASAVRVSQDYDTQFSFADLQTYGWIQESGMARDEQGVRYPLIEQRIQDAVDRTLASKGYRKVNANDADFVVAFHAGTEDKLDVYSTYDYYGYGWRRGFATQTTNVRQYTEGTLLIDVIATSTRELVWRGVGSKSLSSDRDPEKVTQRINEAVADILAEFPPQPEAG